MADETEELEIKIPVMTVLNLPETDRAKHLRACARFVEGTQHDHLVASWGGAPRKNGESYLAERMRGHGFVASSAAPYGIRKPNVAYPLPRQITTSFTELLLGEGRHPTLGLADPNTEAYLDAVIEEAETWDSLVEARDYAGAVGSSALALSVVSGQPTTEMLQTESLHPYAWKQGARWEPLDIVEQKLIEVMEPDEETGELVPVRYWRTRRWTTEHVFVYQDVVENWGKEEGDDQRISKPIPIDVDEDGTPMAFEHMAGRCPVIWMQNTRNSKAPEGKTDSHGCEHLSDELDRLQSFLVRAVKANVDPTLVYLDERIMHRRNPILRKGWGSVIKGTEKAKVELLEIAGNSIKLAIETIELIRDEYLQTVGCVVVDPKTAGAYQSGEALSLLWRRMEAKANRLRVPLRQALKQMASIWMSIGSEVDIISTEADDEGDNDKPTMSLPPKEIPGENGADPKLEAHTTGKGRHVKVAWPPYHVPTPTQMQAMAMALATSTGQKASMSQESAVRLWTAFLGRGDASEEYQRILDETEARSAQFEKGMFPGDADGDEKGKAEDAEKDAEDEDDGAGD